GVVVVAQAMNRELADTARDDDVRRAIGTTTRGLVRSSVMLLAPATLFGVAGAVVLAIFASSLFPRGLARQAEVDPGIRIDGLVLVAGAAALLVGCFAMSLLAAPRAS